MVKYYLAPSKLDQVHGSVARVQTLGAANLDDVIARMQWEHPGLQRADALRILHCYFEAVQGLLLDGRSVNTPLEHFRLSIRGTFTDLGDSFHPGQHAVVPTVSPSRQLKALVQKQACLEKVFTDRPRPTVQSYYDAASSTVNQVLTPGASGRVQGRRLRFALDDLAQGVFFVAADGIATRAADYVVLPGTVVFTVPALAPGCYGLEVRAAMNRGGEVRVGQLAGLLAVA